MADYIKLDQPPRLIVGYPTCGACYVEVNHDDGNWVCPQCGTSWSTNACDDDEGTLYEDWSGDVLDSPVFTHRQAFDHHVPTTERPCYCSVCRQDSPTIDQILESLS